MVESSRGAPVSPIYLDNHATTRMAPSVVEAMMPYLGGSYGNPSSRTHEYGRRAAAAVAEAREMLASLVGAAADDVIFTSGATESNNLAIKGICHSDQPPGHIVTSCTEHHAVLDVCRSLEGRGWRISYLPARTDGRVTASDVAGALRSETRLVTIMWANNETGVINDVHRIAALCRGRGVLFHCDAAQAVGRVPVDVSRAGIDLLSVSAHKFYGPMGVGALVAARPARRAIRALHHGGAQEQGLRPGSIPVHQVVGLGEASRLATEDLRDEVPAKARALCDIFLSMVEAAIPVEINGSTTHRLPGSLNLWFRGCDTEALALRCQEVAFSTGSACTSSLMEPSYVILALTGDEKRAAESARFAFGRFTTEHDAKNAAEAIIRHVRELLAVSRRVPSEHGSARDEPFFLDVSQ